MNGHHSNARQSSSSLYCSSHCIGNVTELQVEEYARNQLSDSPHCLGAFRREQLAAYFDQTDPVAKPANELNGLVYIWKV
jgi:hypothetical protein